MHVTCFASRAILFCDLRYLFIVAPVVSGRESFKEVNSLHLPLERYSPVRRASEGCATGLGSQYRSSPQHHLHSYPHTHVTTGDKEANVKALQQEYQQLQQVNERWGCSVSVSEIYRVSQEERT